MRNIFSIILFCLGFQLLFAQTSLNQSEMQTFKTQVIKMSNNIETIVSDFTQYKHLSFLNNDIKTFGNLIFKSPNAVRWEYTSPYQYIAIFKDNRLFINDGGDKNNIDVGSSKMFRNLNNLIINSVKGNMFDDTEFTITYFRLEENYLVKFIPKDNNMRSFISSFELVFDHKTYDVIEVKMIEPSDDYTKIIFDNKTLNTSVNDSVFNN